MHFLGQKSILLLYQEQKSLKGRHVLLLVNRVGCYTHLTGRYYITTPLFLKITWKKRKYSTLAPPIDLNGRPSDITGPESQDRGERLSVEAELAQAESE
jgi:hypothetical protein